MITKTNPSNGQHIADFPITSPDETRHAVARARAAYPAWSQTPLKERLRILGRLRALIQSNADDYARRISLDTGKPLGDAMLTELMSIPLFLDYYDKTAAKVLGRRKIQTPIVFPGKASYMEYFPMGVIGVISPWNFPFQLAMIPTISALIAGNTVVLKPSEVTPITGELMRELFQNIGLPQGVVEVIQGDGSTGAALVEADIDKVFFTGSLATGRRVMASAAQKPIPVELELGGKDAMIVCHDANLKRAAKAATWGGFVNCGQVCVSVERLFVVDSVYDEFIALLKTEVEALRVGAPDEDADVGPLIAGPQIDIVKRHVQKARDEGATILTGGEPVDRPGQFFQPTVITGVTPEMTVYKEETFGPLLPIIRVRDEDEAMRLANGHQYGLNGSVWTQDIARGIELASRMECGQCSVNDLVLSVGNPVLPFGGVKASGFGRYHGPEGLLAFSHQKAILVDRGWLNADAFWFPNAGKYSTMLDMVDGLLRGNIAKAGIALTKLQVKMNFKRD